jgi:hypothetical protein
VTQSSRQPVLSPIARFAFFYRSRNFPIRIKLVSDSHRPCAQSYPQNLCRTLAAVPALAPNRQKWTISTSAERVPSPSRWNRRFDGLIDGFATNYTAASNLSIRNFPIRIKVLTDSQVPCSQSYPQKMCRTLLAVQLATRYIAGFTDCPPSPKYPLKFRSFFCSPFSKLQAGLSGCC